MRRQGPESGDGTEDQRVPRQVLDCVLLPEKIYRNGYTNKMFHERLVLNRHVENIVQLEEVKSELPWLHFIDAPLTTFCDESAPDEGVPHQVRPSLL